MSSSPLDFHFFELRIFLISFLSPAVLFVAVCISLALFVKNKTVSQVLGIFSAFLVTWIVTAAFVLPLVESSAVTDPAFALPKTSIMNLSLVTIVAILAAMASLSKARVVVTVYTNCLLIFILGPNLPLITHAIFLANSQNHEWHGSELSSQSNLLVISFDGVPGPVVREVLNENKNLRDKFGGFVFFENLISSAPATHASIRSELFGNQNYHDISRIGTEVNTALKSSNSIFQYTDDFITYGVYSDYHDFPERVQKKPASFITSVSEHRRWRILTLHRIYGNKGVSALRKAGVLKILDNLDVSLFRVFGLKDQSTGLEFPNVKLSMNNLTFDELASFYSSTDFLVFRDFVDQLNVTGKNLKVKLMHFDHTHYPVNFDENCNLLLLEPELRKTKQSSAGLKMQTICALTEFSKLVDRLRKLRSFDNSFIVFKSDHGEPVRYFDKPPLNLRINEHEIHGIARYKPTLLIKPMRTTSQTLEYRDFNFLVSLSDLARTLCDEFNHQSNCDDIPGFNLIRNDEANAAPSHVFVEIIPNKNSSFRFEDHSTFKLDRITKDFVAALQEKGILVSQ